MLNKDKSLCLYINYYILNKVTKKNCLALLLINEILNCLTKTKFLLKINFKNIYYYILITEKNC